MIGIHERAGSFSDRWIEVCKAHSIPYRLINCLSTDIVEQCRDLDAVFWHWYHNEESGLLAARQIIHALEQSGIAVFPNFATCFHYDDKLAQKYLLEAIQAPIAPTWVFFDKAEAMTWIRQASWPKVFKLRNGAASMNVRLVKSQKEAERLCNIVFGRGLPAVPGYFADMQTRIRNTKTREDFLVKARRAPSSIARRIRLRRELPRHRGYLYFQQFLPDNRGDVRITVIGNRAFGFERLNRPHDFRASGSGQIVYDPEHIDKRCVEIAFRVTEKIGAQTLAFDFIYNAAREPMIVEISYCYLPGAVHACAGYWDRDLNWIEGHVWPQDAILADVLSALDRENLRFPSAGLQSR